MTKVELAAITDAIRRTFDLPGADRLTIKALVADLGNELGSINPKFNEDSFRFDCFGFISIRGRGDTLTAKEKLAERADAHRESGK